MEVDRRGGVDSTGGVEDGRVDAPERHAPGGSEAEPSAVVFAHTLSAMMRRGRGGEGSGG